jgi:hypothetical protein
MELGELLIFSGLMMYQSGSNTSDKHRYSPVGMYQDVSVKEFVAPSLSFNYRGMTLKEYFDQEMPN